MMWFLLNLPILISTDLIVTPYTIIEQRLIGVLLGDGWLERKSETSNVRFRYEQSGKHAERFFSLYYFFVFFCFGFAKIRERLDKRTNAIYTTHQFSTRSLPFFVPFYLMFYPAGTKIIPANIIFYLTPIAFAQLIMDDGTWARYGVVIQTNGFLPSDVEILISAINNNFNLNCYMRFERNQPIIYIPAKNMVTLRKVVLPHMHSSTHYKLGL
jgi:LAGLIDADG DNA endonuclease family